MHTPTSVTIEPYNPKPQARNAYRLRVEGEYGAITSWHPTIVEAAEEAVKHSDRVSDWRAWEEL